MSGLAAAIGTGAAFNAMPSSPDDYPYGYRAKSRIKTAAPDKKAKRKAQRRARRITRNRT